MTDAIEKAIEALQYADAELCFDDDCGNSNCINRREALKLLREYQSVLHCKDCCCARSWQALGISEYTGKSIPEHIEELVQALREH